MNMLPINSEWKRRIQWAEKQRREQKPAGKIKNKSKKQPDEKLNSVEEGSHGLY